MTARQRAFISSLVHQSEKILSTLLQLFACFPCGPGGKELLDNPSPSILLSQVHGKLARMSQLLQSIKERPGGDMFCLFICLLWKANTYAKNRGIKEADN